MRKEKIMKIFFNKKILISSIIITVVVLTIIIFIYILKFGGDNITSQNDPKSRISEFFEISIDENVISSEMTLIDRESDEILYAELLIPSNKINTIFENYLHLNKDVDIRFLPQIIKDNPIFKSEFDYYYLRYGDVEKRNKSSITVVQQTKIIIFMKEKDGNIKVILYCDRADWNKYKA